VNNSCEYQQFYSFIQSSQICFNSSKNQSASIPFWIPLRI
jgi:hypothetical protein